MNLKERIKVFN